MSKVTICLTSYNHEKYLVGCIDSILNQTYQDFELYIIDDCSQDSSWDIICDYALKDTRIHPIRHEKNLGTSRLDLLLPDFTGEYVAIAHSDDMWLPEKLEKQVEYLQKHKETAACFTKVYLIDENDDLMKDERYVNYKAFEENNRSRKEWLHYFFYKGNCLCHPSLLIRKNAYRKYNLLSAGLNGLPDFKQWIRVCLSAELFILPERLTLFRVHRDEENASGDTADKLNRLFTEEYFILHEFKNLIKNNEVLQVFPEEASNFIKDGECFEAFAFAKICLNGPRPAYHLLGLEILFDLFQNKENEKQLLSLYRYSRKDYDQDKQKYDIFGLLSDKNYLKSSLYIDFGDGFNEKDCLKQRLFVSQRGYVKLIWDIGTLCAGRKPVALRFDPDEDTYRKIIITDVCWESGQKAKIVPINGTVNDNEYIFYTLDPQFLIEVANEFVLTIFMKVSEISSVIVERHYRDIEDELLKRKDELKRVREFAIEMKDAYESIINSTSWKLISPFNKMLMLIKSKNNAHKRK